MAAVAEKPRNLGDRASDSPREAATVGRMPRRKIERPIRPIAYRLPEAAASLAMSEDHFNRHVRPHLRVVASGNLTLFPVTELEKWAEREAQLELGWRGGGS